MENNFQILGLERLTLWRYYADNGSGFAIGFNKQFHFVENINIAQEADEKIYSIKTEVRYGEKEVRKVIQKFIRIFEKFCHKSANELERDGGLVLLMTHLISVLSTFKDKSFKDEHEVRFFCAEGDAISDPRTMKRPYFFDDKYRDFISIDLKEDLPFVHQRHDKRPVILPYKFSHSDIGEIWIGPCCEFLEARTAIRKLLCENGFNLDAVRIKKVPLPYRLS